MTTDIVGRKSLATKDERNIAQRIADAMMQVTYVQKEKRTGMRYSIVSHDDVTAKVRPALLANGVIYYISSLEISRDGNRTQAKGTVTFINVDNPSETITAHAAGDGIDEQDKGPGKAQSYLVKYALLKTLGLETGDDPDLDQEVQHKSASMQELEAMIEDMTASTMESTQTALSKARIHMSPVQVNSLAQKFKAKVKEFEKKEPKA